MAHLLPPFRHLLLHLTSKPSLTLTPLKNPKPYLTPFPKPQSPTKTLHSTSKGETPTLREEEKLGSNVHIEKSSTIAAIVTSLGTQPGAVGIVRLSGPSAVEIARRVFRPMGKKKKIELGLDCWRPRSHFVEYGVVSDLGGNVVDEVLALPMLAPKSYTREDVVELQCHGNDVCLRRVLRACLGWGTACRTWRVHSPSFSKWTFRPLSSGEY